jgi:hypothetical protein
MRLRRVLFALFLAWAMPSGWAVLIQTDVCIYGATSGGIVAALQAARDERTVALIEPGRHLGGLTSGGLSQTDIGNKGAIGGLAREFYRRVGRQYGQPESWTFEPSVAERTFREMIREAAVPVFFEHRLKAVRKEGARIKELVTEKGDVFRAKVFIDASYEGDLMARAGVSFHIGREGNEVYGETLNGVRAETPKHQFLVPVDPYVERGNPRSGLLPLVQPGEAGIPGTGDHRIQAYNFRLCLTQNVTNKLAITPPANYRADQYELLARYLEALVAAGNPPALGQLMHIQMMPNGKTDINNNGGFSTDYLGANYDYPAASYETRARIWREHENYTRGFLYFLATNSRVPARVRNEMQSWGLCRDEFPDTGGWPHQLYVREARRMISPYVMTEQNCRGQRRASDSVGLAAYTMDSHNCQRIVKGGFAVNEGDVQVGGFPPYPIAYRSLVPREKECDNLLVPVCLAASHIAYGSIRMEPVFMVLGQSAAAAAALAIETGLPVARIDVAELQKRLRQQQQILDWPAPVRRDGQEVFRN